MNEENEQIEPRRSEGRKPWWKGAHGEWYVVIQLLMFALVFFGPRTLQGFPVWQPTLVPAAKVTGAALMLAGAYFIFSGIIKLGVNITPVPYPKEKATLVQSGLYSIVRHPIYCGGILGGFGWALWVHSPLTLLYVLIMLVFFDIKSRREEQWLGEKFSGYAAYRKRVRKLIPFIY